MPITKASLPLPPNSREQPLDVVIVGAGVSGLYAGYRLKHAHPKLQVHILEATERSCGRLYSMPLPGVESIPAELGGMFFNETQALVFDLISKDLKLPYGQVNLNTELAYLRNHRFAYADFEDSSKVPYFVAPDESGLPYHQLLFNALQTIVPELKTLWPINPEGSLGATIAHLREVQVAGEPLQNWGFWNLLLRALSGEAYQLLLGAIGSFSMLSNWNGFDAVLSLVTDMGGQWNKLDHGYQRLPEALEQRFVAAGGSVHLQTPVTGVSCAGAGVVKLATQAGDQYARHVILTLSKGAMARFDDDCTLRTEGRLADSLAAVRSVAASKIFLTYDDLWWRTVPNGPGRIKRDQLAISRTDLPMRQCYYEGAQKISGRGLIIAAYGDESSVTYWEPLISEGPITQLVSELPERARRTVRDQLGELHGVEIPEAVDGCFADWRVAPYYGGWHLWNPGFNSAQVVNQVLQPLADRPVYVCGETFSQYQGWVEGSLTSTEYMLQQKFSLPAPDWLSSQQCLTPYQPS